MFPDKSSDRKKLKHTNDLGSQEVVSWGDASWKVEVPPSSVGDQVIDSPSAGLGVEAVRSDLGPLGGSPIGRRSVVDLCDVGLQWSFVRRSDWIVSVVGSVASWLVLPVRADLVSSIDCDNVVGELEVGATGEVGGGNIQDWVVRALGAYSRVSWLNLAVDGNLVKDGVRGGSGAQRENRCNRELHGC